MCPVLRRVQHFAVYILIAFCNIMFHFTHQVEAAFVTNLPRGTVVVILTGTAMVIHVVIPEVVVETAWQDIQVSQVEDEVVLGEVVICQVLTSRLTPTGHKIPVAEEGISRNRMARGT